MRFMLGIDVGGTFTDFVAYDSETKELDVWKRLSVPQDPTAGIKAGLAGFAHPESIRNARLGTTVATNAILERKGAVIAYVTTEGFRDVPFIQRGNRKYHYDMSWVKPKPLMKRRHCFEVTERVDRYGAIITPLDENGARGVARQIRDLGEIEAVEMMVQAEKVAVPDVHHVVGAVGADEAPVEDRDFCLGDRHIGALDKGGAFRIDADLALQGLACRADGHRSAPSCLLAAMAAKLSPGPGAAKQVARRCRLV
jgi:hypothetical protein